MESPANAAGAAGAGQNRLKWRHFSPALTCHLDIEPVSHMPRLSPPARTRLHPDPNKILISSLRLLYAPLGILKGTDMNSRGELRIDPGSLERHGAAGAFQLVVVHSDASVTALVLKRAAELVSGLNAKVLLVAVHAVPFPSDFASAAVQHAHMVGQLADLAVQCALPVTPYVVMARDWEEGFRFALQGESTVLVGTKKRFWRTSEEHLARVLASEGHQVALLYVE
jgi:hypothetical protein